MMKHLFLLAMVSMTAILAHAENLAYRQSISCDRWKVLEFRTHIGNPDATESRIVEFYASGDTTINQLSYRKVLRANNAINESDEYVAAIREADKQVSVYYIDKEYLLYDFGAQVGDERQIFSGINDIPRSYKNVIKDIQTLEDGRKVLNVEIIVVDEQEQEIDRRQTKWMEGIGSASGLLYTGVDLPGGFIHHLLCAYQGGQCVYTTDDEYFADIVGQFYFSANQVWKYRTTYESEPAEVNVVSFSNAQVVEGMTYYAFQGYLFRSEGNRIYYRHPDLSRPEYLLYDFDMQVGDSLTLFEEGRPSFGEDPEQTPYSFVTAVKTVELLDGRTARRISYNNRADDIEFVGSVDGFLGPLNLPVPTCGCITDLICVSQGNEPLYELYPNACDAVPASIMPVNQQAVWARPTKHIVNGHLLINTNGQTFDALGREHK